MAETSRVSKNEASPETFRLCAGAAAVQLWSETAEDLDAGCLLHPDVHGRAFLIQEVSWLASAPWKPRKEALVPAAVWSSPQRTRAAGAGLLAARILAGHVCGREGHFCDRTVANSARPREHCALQRRDQFELRPLPVEAPVKGPCVGVRA